MEDYEKEVITTSLNDICQNTTAVAEIIVGLRTKLLITEAQSQAILAKIEYLQKFEIYETIMKKKGAFPPFLQILRDTNNQQIADHLETKLYKKKFELGITDESESEGADGGSTHSSSEVKLTVEGTNHLAAGVSINKETHNFNGRNVNEVNSQPDESQNQKVPKKVNIRVTGDGNQAAGRFINHRTYNY